MHMFAPILVVLLAAGCSSADNFRADLFERVNAGDINGVKKIVAAHPEAKDEYLNDGWTALTVSARIGKIDVVNLLLEEGASANRLEGGGNSPLFWAIYYSHEDVVATLLKSGARVHNECDTCEDLVLLAKRKNNEHILKLLIEAEGDRSK
ncbi:ankyrin repeat domain-containing protein [Pinirhizobacter sp.]|uniref:ankyrin repeat domain-containing protein n=1 Tax=Pinirhizobacter sp. TaxID=2950432 RepID=UPI002F3FCEDE